MTNYLVTGRTGGDAYPRLEIRALRKKKEQFTLFIQSLATIMQPEHRPKAARFIDIAGIHGLPYEGWRGDAVANDVPPKGSNGGYCNHQSVLFPTWHRPYILLIEQSIGEVATRLAVNWTRNLNPVIQKAWKDAAKELRFPFWDWTDPTTATEGLPDVLQPQTFTFHLPGSTKEKPITVEVDNPLAFHDFDSHYPDGFTNFLWDKPNVNISYFKDWHRTYRWPSGKRNPTDDYIKIKEKLAGTAEQRGSAVQLRDDVAKLFSYPSTTEPGREASTWDEFSNTAFQSEEDGGWGRHNCGSLERPHNSVHLLIGGIGAMAHNDYAAFDPIFYLHHCNIDRILAFWEYVYDPYWMGNGYKKKNRGDTIFPFKQAEGTWGSDEDEAITEKSDLQPFRKKDGSYWNSIDLRGSHKAQGYTYLPINGVSIDAVLPSEPSARLKERNRCIGLLQSHFSNRRLEKYQAITANQANFMKMDVTTLSDNHQPIDNYRRFAVEVTLSGHAFHGSYWLQLVCDKIVQEGRVIKEEVIGSYAVLSRGDNTHCAACIARKEAGSKLRGIIDIPEDVIIELIANTPGSDPIMILQENISARIVGPNDVLLAYAINEKGVSQESADTTALDRKLVPGIKLVSAAAASPQPENPDSPIRFFDWVEHGDLSLSWKAV